MKMKAMKMIALLSLVATLAQVSAVPGGWKEMEKNNVDAAVDKYFAYYDGARDKIIKEAVGDDDNATFEFVEGRIQVVNGINIVAMAKFCNGDSYHVRMYFQAGHDQSLVLSMAKQVDGEPLSAFNGAVFADAKEIIVQRIK